MEAERETAWDASRQEDHSFYREGACKVMSEAVGK